MSFFDSLRALFVGWSSNGEGDVGAITCHEALNVVHEYLDGELEGVSEEDVKAHFDVCAICYPHLRLEESFKEAVRRAARGERAPPELRAKVLELIAATD